MSWIQVDNVGKDQHNYEEADTKEYHLLKLKLDITGLVEVTVIFISGNCFKQHSTVFEGKGKSFPNFCLFISYDTGFSRQYSHFPDLTSFL